MNMSDKEIENILNMSLDQVMSDRFGRYSKYIIQGRALPDARDGLKPVQRRILFSMNELGLFHNKAYKKSARVVGDVIGKYHPHGDSSIYEAMVRMSQSWKMNEQLVTMHGNNGSIDDDPAAAMRYTEARLAKITKAMLDGIKKETVAFAPNFDDSEKEPTVLPGLMPNLLVNGSKGIAAGYATEMPPHNLGEVIDAIIFKIKSPNARIDTLMKYMQGPDFPTGGVVQGVEGISNAFEKGRGRIVIRSNFKVDNSKTKPSILITEIPYGVIKSKMVREIDEIRFNKKISGIKEVRDQTDRNGLEVFIELVPGSDANAIASYLLSKTSMQVYYNYNNIAIVNNGPKQMGVSDLIDAYLNHQRDVQTKSLTFDLRKDSRKLEIIQGLIKVAGIAEQVIDAIRKASGSKSGVVKVLMERFAFTQLQANAIAELRLYRLSRTDQSIYLKERVMLEARIALIKKILNSKEEFDRFLITLLRNLKKEFAAPRKTKIERFIEKIEVNPDDLIKNEEVWIGISRQGYLKRFSNRAYEANNVTEYELKAMDSLVYLDNVNTTDKLLLFTNMGSYLIVPVHKVIQAKFKDIGKHINDFAQIGPNEKIVSVVSVSDFYANASLIIATSKGKIKRTPIASFEVSRWSKAYIAIKLEPEDEVVNVLPSNGNKEVILITSVGRAVKYSEDQISKTGTKAAGVKGISLLENNFVNSMVVVSQDAVIGLISKRGGAKRIRVNSIIPMGRITQGKQLYRTIKGNPHIVIDSCVVTPNTMMIFRDAENLREIQFNKIEISTYEEGFSIVGPSRTIDGKILSFNKIGKENKTFTPPEEENASEEDKFEAASKAIDAIDDAISIDDILKDLK